MGKPQFCTYRCANSYNHNKIDWKELHSVKIKEDSTFGYILKYVEDRVSRWSADKPKECNIDIPYLKQLWEKQKGICPYTGIQMVFPTHWAEMARNHTLEKVSLDRIDSSKGYVRGNVEFVCMAVNYAKNRWSRRAAMEFFSKVRNQVPTSRPPDVPGGTGSTW